MFMHAHAPALLHKQELWTGGWADTGITQHALTAWPFMQACIPMASYPVIHAYATHAPQTHHGPDPA